MILTNKHDINGALIGMLLGDACIANPNTNPYLTIEHGAKQVPYLLWKKQLLKSFLAGSTYPIHDSGGMVWQSEHTQKLRYLYQDFYKFPYVGASRREKKVNRHLLNRLTPLGLAIWIADDGSLCKRDRVITISTFNFGREGNEIMRTWFSDKFGLDARILANRVKLTTPGKEWFLRFPVKDTRILVDMIKPMIQEMPGMSYKVDVRPYIKTMRSEEGFAKDIVGAAQECVELDRNDLAA